MRSECKYHCLLLTSTMTSGLLSDKSAKATRDFWPPENEAYFNIGPKKFLFLSEVIYLINLWFWWCEHDSLIQTFPDVSLPSDNPGYIFSVSSERKI